MAIRLVEEYRGDTLENIHHGHICGIDESGRIVLHAGDPNWVTYMRSAAKPLQAIPVFRHGIDERFGLTDKEKTIMMASHRAESEHVEALESILRKTGLSEDQLVCHATYPLSGKARDELVIRQQPARRIYHNCSGKHLGILALCKGMGYSLEGYDQPEHPAQQEILSVVAELAGCAQEEVKLGIDGCGFPVFGLSLQRMAAMYLKLACPDLIEDTATRDAVIRMTGVMNAHPHMISASWFICSNLLMDPNIVAKGGAKGVYCFGLRKERRAFALKVLDGSEDEWPLIIATILEQIGYDNKETIERMYRLAPPEMYNDNRKLVGVNKAVFELHEWNGEGEDQR